MKRIKIMLVTLLTLSLTGCNQSDYRRATKLQKEGNYEEAIQIYNGLEDYKESKQNIVYCNEMIDLTNKFNEIQDYLNTNNPHFYELIATADDLVKDNKPMLDETLMSKLETANATCKSKKQEPCDLPESREALEDVLNAYGNVDYSQEQNNLEDLINQVNTSIKQYELVFNPSEQYLIQCLENVSEINGISAATEETDSNNLLHKPNGYTAKIFYSENVLHPNGVDQGSIIENGTDGGGSIEAYETVEGATKRNDYLSTFDGSFFDSGSHTVIGSIIIRTSKKLTATQQKELTQAIIDQLTKVE